MSGAVLLLAIGGPQILDPSASVEDVRNAPDDALARVSYEADGDIVETTNTGGPVDTGDWIAPKAAAPGGFTIRASVTSGSTPSGDSLDTDLALTSTRSWELEQTTVGSDSSTLTVQIKSGSTVLAQGTVTLDVTVI